MFDAVAPGFRRTSLPEAIFAELARGGLIFPVSYPNLVGGGWLRRMAPLGPGRPTAAGSCQLLRFEPDIRNTICTFGARVPD